MENVNDEKLWKRASNVISTILEQKNITEDEKIIMILFLISHGVDALIFRAEYKDETIICINDYVKTAQDRALKTYGVSNEKE